MNEKKFFLTPNEFSVISAGFGLSMVYGLNQIDGRMDTKEICLALHNMYVNNLIENQDSKQFITDPDITEMMRQIKSSHFFVRIEGVIGNAECTFCIYPGESCTVIEENQSNANKVIMYMSDIQKVFDMIVKGSAGKKLNVSCMSATNGRVIGEETLAEDADKDSRLAVLKKCYTLATPMEVEK